MPLIRLLAQIITVSALAVFAACGDNPADDADETYTLTGTVLVGGEGLSGVSVRLTGAGKDTTATTASSGLYFFYGLLNGSYTLVPSKNGYTFVPEFFSVKVSGDAASAPVIAASKNPVPPESPSNLSATAVSSSRIELSWKDNSDEKGFTIERKQGSGAYVEIGTVTANVTIFSVTDLSSDTEYSFRVRAYNATLSSEYSADAAVRTLPAGLMIVSGVTVVSIPGGTFQMGDVEGVGSADEKPVRSVTLTAFQMSVAEITNAEYCEWLNGALGRGEITVAGSSVKGAKGTSVGQDFLNLTGAFDTVNKCWITFADNTFTVASGKEKWPVVYVTWFGAKAFADGNGWDLPSEAEWEYACRGNRQYKYGTDDGTISSVNANYNSNVGHPVDVKSYPKNPFGLYDICGNVFEWCGDWYAAYAAGNQIDPASPQTGTFRVVRGGCFSYRNYGSRSSGRSYYYPTFAGQYVGFRVVRRISQ